MVSKWLKIIRKISHLLNYKMTSHLTLTHDIESSLMFMMVKIILNILLHLMENVNS